MSRLDSRMSEMRYRNGFFERVVREGDLSLVQKQFADGEIELRRGRFFAFDGYGRFTVDGRFRFRRTLFGSFDQSEQVVAAAPVDFELGADAGGIDSANIVLHRAQIAVPQVEIERIDVDDPVVAAVAQFQPDAAAMPYVRRSSRWLALPFTCRSSVTRPSTEPMSIT